MIFGWTIAINQSEFFCGLAGPIPPPPDVTLNSPAWRFIHCTIESVRVIQSV